jgi:glycosyltransferase involved in cell wall biosynthesis
LQLGSPSEIYGAERWILTLVRYLDHTKIEPIIAAINDEFSLCVPLCKEAERLGIRSKVFEVANKADFSVIQSIRNYIVNKKIDIIHTHFYKADIIGLLATKGTKCKIISTPHGWTSEPDFKLRCYEVINRIIFPFMDVVVALSETMYYDLKRIPFLNGKLRLILNAVDLHEIDEVSDINLEMKEWRQAGAFIVGYIGRIVNGKGLDILIRSLSKIRSTDWRLALIGEGKQEAELKALAERLRIQHKIKFIGFRSNRISYLKGFDVFVLPSRSEGIPRSLMEAMAAGVAVVASDIPGCTALIESGKNGFLVPQLSEEKYTEIIEKLAERPQIMYEIRKNARDLIEKKFSAKRMAQEYEDIYTVLSGGEYCKN